MFDNLTALGYGLVAFALVIGVGLVVLSKFSGTLTAGTAEKNATEYLITQFGSTGLAGWVPAIIALVIGLLFLGAFLARKGRSY